MGGWVNRKLMKSGGVGGGGERCAMSLHEYGHVRGQDRGIYSDLVTWKQRVWGSNHRCWVHPHRHPSQSSTEAPWQILVIN